MRAPVRGKCSRSFASSAFEASKKRLHQYVDDQCQASIPPSLRLYQMRKRTLLLTGVCSGSRPQPCGQLTPVPADAEAVPGAARFCAGDLAHDHLHLEVHFPGKTIYLIPFLKIPHLMSGRNCAQLTHCMRLKVWEEGDQFQVSTWSVPQAASLLTSGQTNVHSS